MPRVTNVSSSEHFSDILHEKKGFGAVSAVVVDFSAAWCGPCKMIGPIFETMSDKYPSLSFLKVDVDELSDVAASCGIRAMPTFQTYLGGHKVGELTGADPRKLQQLVEELKEKGEASSSIGPAYKLGASEDSPARAAAGSAAPDSAEGRRAAMAAAAEARMKAMQQPQQ
ncbi:thioredoxin h2 [Dunaliella salina]|uniref:Thioredoxin h2 n=1 Tax=Dunaliella salina TaxID=3046 RepID=A0ABQ7GMI6_DUNSA|nr:thioredoxin h2 [Dunaliella salina]|eukprot:KAF5835823.1 thioredoxin h2 [Dunaliella salina]